MSEPRTTTTHSTHRLTNLFWVACLALLTLLAVYPEHRGKGVGSRLLTQAEGLIEGATMSLVVSNANRDARRLCERLGYRRHASRPKIKGDWDGPGEAWILLVK